MLPIAFGSGADTTFVLVVQGLRVLAMVLVAPALVGLLVRRDRRRAPGPPGADGPIGYNPSP